MEEEYGRISYYAYDQTSQGLKYAFQDASGWTTQTVDSGRDVGKYTSLALDGDGNPHISYFDDRGYLKYTRYTFKPSADFAASPLTGAAPLTVTFTAVTSGTVENWLWDFGDGDSASTGPVISHTYVTSDTFDVSLTVSNALGSFVVSRPGYITVWVKADSHLAYLPLVLRRTP
jgi:PKD repeat protein